MYQDLFWPHLDAQPWLSRLGILVRQVCLKRMLSPPFFAGGCSISQPIV